MKFREYNQHQGQLFPNNIDDLVPDDSIVRVIDDIIEQMNLAELYDSYSEEGQPGYHPKMLLKVLLYGYSKGITSSRKIAQEIESNIYYMYLSGDQRPDFRTISDFRKNKMEYFVLVFLYVLNLCKQMGMTSLGHIAIDGSKIEANASRALLKDAQEIAEMEKRLEEQIRELIKKAEITDEQEDQKYGRSNRGDELPEKLRKKEERLRKIREAKKTIEEQGLKRVSITDPDARMMITNTGGKDLCYNAQAAVDSENQIIVACDVTSQEDDHEQFIPLYEKTVINMDEKPKEVSADAGYQSGRVYMYMEKNNIDGYMPDSKFNAETDDNGNEVFGKYDRRNFIYNEEDDTYCCPEKGKMIFWEKAQRNGVRYKVYKGIDCKQCKHKKECIIKNPQGESRHIQIYENDKYKAAMRKKLLSEEGSRKYNKRMYTVEPVFANIKRGMGIQRFFLRGIDKVKNNFYLICASYNIKKIAKHLKTSTG